MLGLLQNNNQGVLKMFSLFFCYAYAEIFKSLEFDIEAGQEVNISLDIPRITGVNNFSNLVMKSPAIWNNNLKIFPAFVKNYTSGDMMLPYYLLTDNINRVGEDFSNIDYVNNKVLLTSWRYTYTDGKLKWRYAISQYYSSLYSDFLSSAIASDGTIYVGSRDYNLYAINSNGILKWKYATGDGIASSPAIASDGTIYVGSLDYNLYAINPNGSLQWKYTTGSYIYSSPAISSDGTIYVGSNDRNLYAINSNGSLKWKYATGSDIYSSPAISSDGTIYVGSNDHNLYAISSNNYVATSPWPKFHQNNLNTGAQPNTDSLQLFDFRFLTINGVSNLTQKLFVDFEIFDNQINITYYLNKVIKNLEFNLQPKKSINSFINLSSIILSLDKFSCLSVRTKNILIKDFQIMPKFIRNYIYGETVPSYYLLSNVGSDKVATMFSNISDNTKIQGLSTSFLFYTPGKLKWKYATGSRIYSSPAIVSDGTIYVGSNDNSLYAINPNGNLKWKYATGYYGGDNTISSPAISSDGTIYVGSYDKNLYTINSNGSLKWKYATGSYIYSSPAISSDGTIYVGSKDFNLYAINPNGSLKWKYVTGSGIYSSPAIASDGTIYVGSGYVDKNLYAISSNNYVSIRPWPKFRQNNLNNGAQVNSSNLLQLFDIRLLTIKGFSNNATKLFVDCYENAKVLTMYIHMSADLSSNNYSTTITNSNNSTLTVTSTTTDTDTDTDSDSNTLTATNSITNTQSNTPTNSNQQTKTITSTDSNTVTSSNTLTNTHTNSKSSTPTRESTNTETLSNSGTISSSLTVTSTTTDSNSITLTASNSITNTQSNTPTNSNQQTKTITSTYSNTATGSNTLTNSHTESKSSTPTRESTNTETVTNSDTSSSSPTLTVMPTTTDSGSTTLTTSNTITNTQSNTPINSNQQTKTITSTDSNTATGSNTLTNSHTESKSSTPTRESTNTETLTNSDTPSSSQTLTVIPTTTDSDSTTLTTSNTITNTQSNTPTNSDQQTKIVSSVNSEDAEVNFNSSVNDTVNMAAIIGGALGGGIASLMVVGVILFFYKKTHSASNVNRSKKTSVSQVNTENNAPIKNEQISIILMNQTDEVNVTSSQKLPQNEQPCLLPTNDIKSNQSKLNCIETVINERNVKLTHRRSIFIPNTPNDSPNNSGNPLSIKFSEFTGKQSIEGFSKDFGVNKKSIFLVEKIDEPITTEPVLTTLINQTNKTNFVLSQNLQLNQKQQSLSDDKANKTKSIKNITQHRKTLSL